MRTKIIRLRRKGARRTVFFEIIVTFKNRRANGSGLLEKLGYIDIKGSAIVINGLRLGFLLNKGVVLHKNVKRFFVGLVS